MNHFMYVDDLKIFAKNKNKKRIRTSYSNYKNI